MERKVPTYSLSHPAALWNGADNEEPLPFDGGQKRPEKPKEKELKDARS